MSEPKLEPEWAKLRREGWTFHFDLKTRFLFAEHPQGGKFSIADFKHCRDDLLANQIGGTVAYMLNND